VARADAVGPTVDVNDLVERLLTLLAEELGSSVSLEVLPRSGVAPPGEPPRHGRAVPLLASDGRVYGRLWVADPAARGKGALADAVSQLISDRLAAHREARTVWDRRVGQVRTVLDDRGFDVVFQPIADLRDGVTVGVEALSRFPTPPDLSPDRWFDDASSVGLGVELELAAIERAITAFDALPPGAYLSVNLSPSTVLSPALRRAVASCPLDRLVFEITEHAAVVDYEALNTALRPWRRDGVRLAVDDAGAGFASLRHILRMSPDIIKLDISLTQGIDKDAVQRALSYSIASFGSAIDAAVVAEGVSSEQELNALRFLGIAYGQGFHLAAPAPLPADGSLAASLFSRSTTG
jgi:EAL domain-containing protein (putative c-di-GMP-specific phosphodiesterase class I)